MYLYILDKQKSDHTDRLRNVAEKSKESDVNFVIHRGKLYKISKTFSNFGFLDLITNFMNDQANHYRANFMVYSEERDGFEFLYKNYFDEKLHRNKPRIADNQIVFKTSPNEGLILYYNGEIFMGTLINGYRNTNGHGIYVYSNGTFEMGDFLDDKLHCENGVTTIEGGVTLYGAFRGGEFIRGEKKYLNGDSEKGEFLHDKLHCENGVKTIEGGVTLYGTFREGEFISGEKKYLNGDSEKGKFLHDKLHCENGVKTIEGEVTLYGTFREGEFIRGEKKDWKENVELKGKIESEALTGKGVKLFPNDLKNKGEFKNGQDMCSPKIKPKQEVSLKELLLEEILGNFSKEKRKNIFKGFKTKSTSSNKDMSILLPESHYMEYLSYFHRKDDEDSPEALEKRAEAFISIGNPAELKIEQGASIQVPQSLPFLGEASIAQATAQGQDSDIENETIDHEKFGIATISSNVSQVEADQSITEKSTQPIKDSANASSQTSKNKTGEKKSVPSTLKRS